MPRTALTHTHALTSICALHCSVWISLMRPPHAPHCTHTHTRHDICVLHCSVDILEPTSTCPTLYAHTHTLWHLCSPLQCVDILEPTSTCPTLHAHTHTLWHLCSPLQRGYPGANLHMPHTARTHTYTLWHLCSLLQCVDFLDETSTCPALHTQYEICVDKGTYDAICLNPDDPKGQRARFMASMDRLVKDCGLLVLTSCNWTVEELREHFKERKWIVECQLYPVWAIAEHRGRVAKL